MKGECNLCHKKDKDLKQFEAHAYRLKLYPDTPHFYACEECYTRAYMSPENLVFAVVEPMPSWDDIVG